MSRSSLQSRNPAPFADTVVSVDQTVDGDHGRIETRRVTVIHDVEWLKQRHKWPGLSGVVVVDSLRETRAGSESETRLYLTSSNLGAEQLGPTVRQHWGVENSLHWVMDMTFHDDQCRIRTDNAPENFVTLKHMAVNITRRKKGKDSIRLRSAIPASRSMRRASCAYSRFFSTAADGSVRRNARGSRGRGSFIP